VEGSAFKAVDGSVTIIPVYVNNDANCFAVGEYFFGKGQKCG
jgi:predicted NBD/HSP70 family sugar kinase